MNEVLRRVGRIKSCITGLALAAAMGIAGSAPAQFGEAAGFGQLMSPYYLRRDLQLFVEGLRLDEGQSVILESLFWDYEDEQEAGRDRMIEQLTDMREDLQALDRERILKLIFVPFEERSAEWDDLNDRFIDSIKAILNNRQLEQWPRFARQLRREKQLPIGRFSGEKLDLFKIIREMDLEEPTRTVIAPVLDEYDWRMEDALAKRESLFRQSRLAMMSSMREEDPEKALATYDHQIAARVEVRNVNDEYIEVVAAALPDGLGRTFRQMALERAYPRVFRPTPAQRIFAAARELESLSPEILQAVIELELAYLGELAGINDTLARLIRDHEPKDERYRAAVFALRGTGQRPEKPKDPTREEFRRRDELDRRYMEQLQALLTKEQFASLPGAQRYIKVDPSQRSSRPGGKDAMKDRGGSKKRDKPAGFGRESRRELGKGGPDGPK